MNPRLDKSLKIKDSENYLPMRSLEAITVFLRRSIADPGFDSIRLSSRCSKRSTMVNPSRYSPQKATQLRHAAARSVSPMCGVTDGFGHTHQGLAAQVNSIVTAGRPRPRCEVPLLRPFFILQWRPNRPDHSLWRPRLQTPAWPQTCLSGTRSRCCQKYKARGFGTPRG